MTSPDAVWVADLASGAEWFLIPTVSARLRRWDGDVVDPEMARAITGIAECLPLGDADGPHGALVQTGAASFRVTGRARIATSTADDGALNDSARIGWDDGAQLLLWCGKDDEATRAEIEDAFAESLVGDLWSAATRSERVIGGRSVTELDLSAVDLQVLILRAGGRRATLLASWQDPSQAAELADRLERLVAGLRWTEGP